MLGKEHEPAFDEMLEFCGKSGEFWFKIESFLESNYDLEKAIRFPYGKDYGWGVSYKHRGKHVCDIHAEAGAFAVFFQVRAEAIEAIRKDLSDYALKLWDNRYPCGNGGWVRYRVTKEERIFDAQKLLAAKVKPKNE